MLSTTKHATLIKSNFGYLGNNSIIGDTDFFLKKKEEI